MKRLSLYGILVDAADYGKTKAIADLLVGFTSMGEPLPNAKQRAVRTALTAIAQMRLEE